MRGGVWALLFLSSCFIGYDSRWGEAERSQKVVAKHAAPSELHGTPDESSTARLSVQKVRVYVTADYAAQVSDEPKQIGRLIDRANEVLEPTLRLRLEIEERRRWPASSGDLDDTLARLEKHDAGTGVGWVVGFVGALPTLETSFTELGRARMHGRHFVVRAMNDAVEYDSFAKNLDELDDVQRIKLYRSRLEHKETAVFLHELGHTLGVPHEVVRTTLMHTRYDKKSQSYSEHAAALMRMSLAQRVDPNAMTLDDLARSLVKYVNETSSNWVAADRDEWLAGLGPSTPQPQVTAQRPAAFAAARWKQLTNAEREAYLRALEHEELGGIADAWREAEPLFTAHPDGHEIQDLRCRLAMRIGGGREQVAAHCADFTRLEKAAHAH